MTIVILVTVLAAVLPAVSPNNEGRKIREATRQLTSLFAQAQAQAARDGRPVGVGFSDLDEDGMALEAFLIAEPPPFAGFSEASAVRITPGSGPIVAVQFGHNVGGEAFQGDQSDQLPPSTFRVGDILEVGRERFEILADDLDEDDPDDLPDVDNPNPPDGNPMEYGYLRQQNFVTARWLTMKGRSEQLLPQGGKAYHIRRRPSTSTRPSRTAAAALQFPRGVGIDLVASGVEPQLFIATINTHEYGFTTMRSPNLTAVNEQNNVNPPETPFEPPLSVGIMFSPTGQVESVFVNGERLQGRVTHVHLLLGRIENANTDVENPDMDFSPASIPHDSSGDDELEQRRERVNWLNADSRWVNIAVSSGRVTASDNYVSDDPRDIYVDLGSNPELFQQAAAQIESSRQFAEEFASDSGR